MNAIPDLSVLMHGSVAARLRGDQGGNLSLTYDGGYMEDPRSIPLSLSLPFSERPHDGESPRRWIRSLLPDNPETLSRWYAREEVLQRSPVGLLSTRIGLDCAGAVQFCPVGDEERLAERSSGIQDLTRAEVAREIATVVGQPGAWHPDDVEPYFSLGGYQSKIALYLEGHQWGRPYGNVPTTHILKPRSQAGSTVAVAEHLCLSAARALGLEAAASTVEQFEDNTVLVVERYDREPVDGTWRRIHQEDMCQALGLDGAQKYEHSGGPGMAAIGDLIRLHSTRPDADIRRFGDALIYSWLVINRDAHARNYSIIHAHDRIRLAPLYDINSSLMFRRRKIGEANMAMRYGNTFTVYSAGSKQALPDMALRLRIPASALVDRAEEMASGLPEALQFAIQPLPPAMQNTEDVAKFASSVQRRSEECLKSIHSARRHLNRAGTSTARPEPTADIDPSMSPCPKRVRYNDLPCVLRLGHRGNCRSR